jgi:hypothetical protein
MESAGDPGHIVEKTSVRAGTEKVGREVGRGDGAGITNNFM